MSKNDKMDFGKFFASMAAVFKSVPDDKLADLKDSIDHVNVQDIPDMFNRAGGEHDAPSRAQIVTGPAEKMSGAGAEPMIHRYSDGSAQAGLTATYERFEKILADFSKSMNASFDRRFAPLADVVSDLVKNQQALDAFIKSVQAEQEATAKADVEETFLGKAMEKAEKARKAFRKAEMEEDEEEREERKSRLTEIADTLKSALKLVSKADDEDEGDEEEVEKALKAIKSLQTKVSTALTAITKAEEDEKKEEEAEKARAAADATVKAEETSEEEEKKDDTAKSLAAVHAQLAQVQEALKGNAVLSETVKGLMDQVMGQSKGAANLVSPPDFSVIKGGLDPSVSIPTAIDNGELVGPEALAAKTLLGRRAHVAAGNYPQDKFNADLAAAPAAVRRHFA